MMRRMRQDSIRRQSMRSACRLLFLLVLAFPASPVTRAQSPTHWAFRKPSRPEPPARDSLKHAENVRNPIDQFVLQRLEAAGLEPAPRAGRATLVRRAYYDLLGLPPTPEQVEAFLKDDSPEAWPRLIETLLT